MIEDIKFASRRRTYH